MARKPTHYPVTEWYLEYRNPAQNSSKFYQVFVTETGLCVIRYGRIGSSGQYQVTAFPTFDEARALGMRQFYAKQTKGYQLIRDAVVFNGSVAAIDAARRENGAALVRECEEALANGSMEGSKDAVLRVYEDFTEKAKTLLGKASTLDPEVAMEELSELKRVWTDIETLHAEAAIAMELTESTIATAVFA